MINSGASYIIREWNPQNVPRRMKIHWFLHIPHPYLGIDVFICNPICSVKAINSSFWLCGGGLPSSSRPCLNSSHALKIVGMLSASSTIVSIMIYERNKLIQFHSSWREFPSICPCLTRYLSGLPPNSVLLQRVAEGVCFSRRGEGEIRHTVLYFRENTQR